MNAKKHTSHYAQILQWVGLVQKIKTTINIDKSQYTKYELIKHQACFQPVHEEHEPPAGHVGVVSVGGFWNLNVDGTVQHCWLRVATTAPVDENEILSLRKAFI